MSTLRDFLELDFGLPIANTTEGDNLLKVPAVPTAAPTVYIDIFTPGGRQHQCREAPPFTSMT